MTSPLTMSKSEREAFLADVHVGVLAVARDGAPLVGPIWYLYEPGGDVVMSIGPASEKARLLAATGRASLCAQREAVPYAFVTVEGPVTLSPGDEAERTRLAERYLGDIAPRYLEDTRNEASVIVRLTPERWRTQDYTRFAPP